MIDSATLGNVIEALAVVCEEKAEHIRSNWQDSKTARSWELDARTLNRVTLKIWN